MGDHNDRVEELQRQIAEIKRAMQDAQEAAMQRQVEQMKARVAAAQAEAEEAKARVRVLEAEKEARLKSVADYTKPVAKITVSPLVLPWAPVQVACIHSGKELKEEEPKRKEEEVT